MSTLEVLGRLVEASNQTFLVADDQGRRFVHKPVAGEAPLPDFPRATLGRREVAARVLSEAAGFDVVPATSWIEDGPFGPGSLQEWMEPVGLPACEVVPVDEVPEGWLGILLGRDEQGRDLALVHADQTDLRRLALFDLVANNADRKVGHVLVTADGLRGVDHGVCFHVEDKLRTVLWGWSGEVFTPDEIVLLEACAQALDPLSQWLSTEEVEALAGRVRSLLEAARWPRPPVDRYPLPWPLW